MRHDIKRAVLAVLSCLVVFCGSPLLAKTPANNLKDQKKLRKPIDLRLSKDNRWLYIANRSTGSISVIDAKSRKVVNEQPVGKQLTALAISPDGKLLVAADDSLHQLILMKPLAGKVEVLSRMAISPYPVRMAFAANGKRLFVTSLWSRRVSQVDVSNHQKAKVQRVLDLPFAPRCLISVRKDSRLIIADSFSGRLGIIDVAKFKVQAVREFPAHNIRGLSVSNNGKMLLIAHQMLNELAHTVRNDVHWGLLMSNDLRWLRLDLMLSGAKDLYKGGRMHPLGEAGSATGDPAGLAVAPNGTVVVTLGGVGEVAVGKEKDYGLRRRQVGKRPTGVVVSSDSQTAYMTDTFRDTVVEVALIESIPAKKIKLGPAPKLTLAQQGERLFFNAKLSHDGWMSCHSCHTDGHTNSMLNDNLSDGSFGAPKRVLSLLGRAKTAPFAWNGGAANLEMQVRKSIRNTMQSDDDPNPKHVKAIAAFVRTLKAPPSLDKVRGLEDPKRIARGKKLFLGNSCNRCHVPPTFTSPSTYNVGLTDKLGNKLFNPPTLRGVGQRGPYFHDARAKSLNDVLMKYRHQLKKPLTKKQFLDIRAFLRSL